MSDKRKTGETYDPDDDLIELPEKRGSARAVTPPPSVEDPPAKRRSLTERLADAARDRERRQPRD